MTTNTTTTTTTGPAWAAFAFVEFHHLHHHYRHIGCCYPTSGNRKSSGLHHGAVAALAANKRRDEISFLLDSSTDKQDVTTTSFSIPESAGVTTTTNRKAMILSSFISFLSSLALVAATTAPALAATATNNINTKNNNIERGSELFSANCAGCHAGGLNFVNESRTLKKRSTLSKYVMNGKKNGDLLDQATVQNWVVSSGSTPAPCLLQGSFGRWKANATELGRCHNVCGRSSVK
jgi:hypothetical protein